MPLNPNGRGWLVLFCLVLLSAIQVAVGLPGGAPSRACGSMYPLHPGPNGSAIAQSGFAPFKIEIFRSRNGNLTYEITVKRSSGNVSQAQLRGFFLQVRDHHSEEALGEWTNLPLYGRIGDCGGRNTVTHVLNNPKDMEQGLHFTWESVNLSAINAGPFHVLGTFVENLHIFWVMLSSENFTITPDGAGVSSTPVDFSGTSSFEPINNVTIFTNPPVLDAHANKDRSATLMDTSFANLLAASAPVFPLSAESPNTPSDIQHTNNQKNLMTPANVSLVFLPGDRNMEYFSTLAANGTASRSMDGYRSAPIANRDQYQISQNTTMEYPQQGQMNFLNVETGAPTRFRKDRFQEQLSPFNPYK